MSLLTTKTRLDGETSVVVDCPKCYISIPIEEIAEDPQCPVCESDITMFAALTKQLEQDLVVGRGGEFEGCLGRVVERRPDPGEYGRLLVRFHGGPEPAVTVPEEQVQEVSVTLEAFLEETVG